MKSILVCLLVLSGVLQGQEDQREKKMLICGLELEQHGRVAEGTLGYRLKVTLTYNWFRQKMVRGDKGLQLMVVK